MTTNEYLKQVLKSQTLKPDGKELAELDLHRSEVEDLLRERFPDVSPTIRHGGSRAKGTMISESYDLDIVCYFPSDDTSAGDSLEDVYNNVKGALEGKYAVNPKTSSLRLKSKKQLAADFHIDVVPGRYVDESETDCFIHQNAGPKARLKTNLDVHVAHIKEAGVTDAIRLLKLWKVRKGLQIKQFAWELLIVKLLQGKTSSALEDQLAYVLTEISESEEPLTTEDPANLYGNDLFSVYSDNWPVIKAHALSTLSTIEHSGWEAVFGPADRMETSGMISILTRAAAAAPTVSKPWSDIL